MSKTLPPKINLREGKREEGGRKKGRGGDGGREEEDGKRPFNGDRREKSLRFNGIKTAQLLEGARAAVAAERSLGVLGEPGSIFLSLLRFGDGSCSRLRPAVQRCESQ